MEHIRGSILQQRFAVKGQLLIEHSNTTFNEVEELWREVHDEIWNRVAFNHLLKLEIAVNNATSAVKWGYTTV